MATASYHSPVDPGYSAHLRNLSIQAALAVQDSLKSAFRSSMDVGYKKDRHDIVTVHDKAAEDQIRSYLSAAVPDSEIIGEEAGRRGQGALQWYVDPIDGTANFARGLPSWCISVGAVLEDNIVAGAIIDPLGGNIFSADLRGAYLGDGLMRSNAAGDEKSATLITSYPSARDLQIDGAGAALDRFGTLVETYSAVRRSGSAALGLAHVAAGWADAGAGFGINPWDVTAGILILRQAGGTYTPLSYGDATHDEADHHCPAYIATGEGAGYPVLRSVASSVVAGRSG
jgi:myo-inositol-1(or 4)-monophosphatase